MARDAKGHEALRAQIAKIEKLSRLPIEAAPALKDAVEKEAKKSAAAGRDPMGERWRPRKIDGAKVLKRAAQAVKVVITKNVILIQVSGHYARHHLGLVKGTGNKEDRRRKVIPTAEIPDDTAKAMKRVAVMAFEKVMR